MMPRPTLFDGARMTMDEAMSLTLDSLREYGPGYDHWAVAWSGGKDSTATLTLLIHALQAGLLEWPDSLTVLYADTRQELPPLYATALTVMDKLNKLGIAVKVCRADLDKRFMVYMLGRGVPPPNNRTLRWCTRQIKVDPMETALADVLDSHQRALVLTGVRQGESAIRDGRIAMSCSRDGAECGQGWYQRELPESKGAKGRIATLAPLLHWRVCHVWDWLMFYAPNMDYGAWPVQSLPIAYGGEEAEEVNARTGCVGCPLASQDAALDRVIRHADWQHLAPLGELRPLYRELRLPHNRLRKAGLELTKSGRPAANPQRMGPLTFDARRMGLERVLDIQSRCNRNAPNGRRVDILNSEEVARIEELIDLETWPNGWDGTEPMADVPLDLVFVNGVQPRFGFDAAAL